MKMKTNYLQPVAVFMIALIIALPIYSADVIAENSMQNAKIYGSYDIQGYVTDKDDLMKFTVEASYDGKDISADQVELMGTGADKGMKFESCEDLYNGYFRCFRNSSISFLLICAIALSVASVSSANTVSCAEKQRFITG